MSLSPSIRSRLAFQHQTVGELISGYNEEHLKLRPIPAKWSVFENIGHLVAYEIAFQQRIEKILKGDNPLIERYTAENDPLFFECVQRPLQQLLRNLDDERRSICNTLLRLDPIQLSLSGQHPVYGSLTLTQWSEFVLLHESHHLFTIFKLIHVRS